MRSLFSTTLQNPELLPPVASDCAARRRLTKSEEEETIIINRSGRSTYPEEKSVQTSGATPVFGRARATPWPIVAAAHPHIRATEQASAYCAKMSKAMTVKNVEEQTFDVGFGKRYTLTFSCEGAPLLSQRSGLRRV
jgi:hypothetical protein